MKLGRLFRSNLWRDRRGGILSVTAITLPVVIMIAALCVDLGTLYLARSKSEIAATLAAEAAEQRLPDIVSAEEVGRQVALAMIHDAGFVSGYDVEVSATVDFVVVVVRLEVNTVLAHFVGFHTLDTGDRVVRPIGYEDEAAAQGIGIGAGTDGVLDVDAGATITW